MKFRRNPSCFLGCRRRRRSRRRRRRRRAHTDTRAPRARGSNPGATDAIVFESRGTDSLRVDPRVIWVKVCATTRGSELLPNGSGSDDAPSPSPSSPSRGKCIGARRPDRQRRGSPLERRSLLTGHFGTRRTQRNTEQAEEHVRTRARLLPGAGPERERTLSSGKRIRARARARTCAATRHAGDGKQGTRGDALAGGETMRDTCYSAALSFDPPSHISVVSPCH